MRFFGSARLVFGLVTGLTGGGIGGPIGLIWATGRQEQLYKCLRPLRTYGWSRATGAASCTVSTVIGAGTALLGRGSGITVRQALPAVAPKLLSPPPGPR